MNEQPINDSTLHNRGNTSHMELERGEFNSPFPRIPGPLKATMLIAVSHEGVRAEVARYFDLSYDRRDMMCAVDEVCREIGVTLRGA